MKRESPARDASIETMAAVDDSAAGTNVDSALEAVQRMALSFRLRPGERINESELSRELGISRTPLREALNRLVAQDLLEMVPSKGFYRREIQPREIFELYQLRMSLEAMAVGLAVTHATAEDLQGLRELAWQNSSVVEMSAQELVRYDEAFHERLANIGGNRELAKMLHRVNLRIRPVRHLACSRARIHEGEAEHIRVVDALVEGDLRVATEILERQITLRYDEVERDVRQLYGEIYFGRQRVGE